MRQSEATCDLQCVTAAGARCAPALHPRTLGAGAVMADRLVADWCPRDLISCWFPQPTRLGPRPPCNVSVSGGTAAAALLARMHQPCLPKSGGHAGLNHERDGPPTGQEACGSTSVRAQGGQPTAALGLQPRARITNRKRFVTILDDRGISEEWMAQSKAGCCVDRCGVCAALPPAACHPHLSDVRRRCLPGWPVIQARPLLSPCHLLALASSWQGRCVSLPSFISNRGATVDGSQACKLEKLWDCSWGWGPGGPIRFWLCCWVAKQAW